MLLCRRCHALVHAGLLFIKGGWKTGWRFFDRQRRDVHEAGPPPGEYLAELAAGGRKLFVKVPTVGGEKAQRIVGIEDVPVEADSVWWRRHAHLLSYRAGSGGFELRPGMPADDRIESGTMCQPLPAGSPALDELV